MGIRVLSGLVLLSLLVTGCKVSASANLQAGNKKKVADFDEPIDDESAVAGSAEAVEEPSEPVALLGARHDVGLAPASAGKASCACLAAAVGDPASPAFQWQAKPPRTDPMTQLVVALSSKGVACDTDTKGSLGASYWGYRQQGDDIVVYVEHASAGRPLVAGAIVPKPIGKGQVRIEPASKKVPYGRPPANEKVCALGNPGPVRTLDSVTPPETPKADDTVEFED